MSDFQFFVQKNSKPLTETQKLQRFFNYILDFKLGEQKSYRVRETNTSKLRQHNHSTKVDDQCLSESSFPNIILSSQSLMISSSLRSTQEKQSIKRQRLSENINLIHYGYSCDKCYINPIVGQRYNCKICDYDLCESCYKQNSQINEGQEQKIDKLPAIPCNDIHEHPLTKVQKKLQSSSNVTQLLFSGRKQKASIKNQHSLLLRSQKLHRSSK